MNAAYYTRNRERLYDQLSPCSALVLFAGTELRKTGDEYYPFFPSRNFVYLTGLEGKESILLAVKDSDGTVSERLYLLPPDPMEERWTGRRITPGQAQQCSGVEDIRFVGQFPQELHRLAFSGIEKVYLDLFRHAPEDTPRPDHRLGETLRQQYPWLAIGDASSILHSLRTIKSPEEIAALRHAEEITKAGILAMMEISKPGLYEYQYKAAFDHALGQFGPEGPGFPSIISAGENNFCIHYYSYTGQAKDGDMILNDVGAQYQHMITDVSRGWPCNGRFSPRQKLLYQCALNTSNYMFSILRPGMPMEQVDKTIRRYNAQQLLEAGVMNREEEIGTYMWHGGAHHIGYDVHDQVKRPELLAPGMVFCVDVGIYHQQWGIGFRLEDNCLITETGCENLSAAIPRTISDIEAAMGSR